jgi:hypothetical protein
MFGKLFWEINKLRRNDGWRDSSKLLKALIRGVKGRWKKFIKRHWDPLSNCILIWRDSSTHPRFLKQLNLLLEAGTPVSFSSINYCVTFDVYKLLIQYGGECVFDKAKLPALININGEWMSWILDHCSPSSRLDYNNFLEVCHEYFFWVSRKDKNVPDDVFPKRKNPLSGLVVMFHRIHHPDIEINEKLVMLLQKWYETQSEHHDLPYAIHSLVEARILKIGSLDPYHPIIDPKGHAKRFDLICAGPPIQEGVVRFITVPQNIFIINLIKEYQVKYQSFFGALSESDETLTI